MDIDMMIELAVSPLVRLHLIACKGILDAIEEDGAIVQSAHLLIDGDNSGLPVGVCAFLEDGGIVTVKADAQWLAP